MKVDITSREDIKIIISKFYDKLLEDENISHFFKEFIVNKTLEKHLEIIVDFWEDLLFQTNIYKRNPMQKHMDFNKKIKFTKIHFLIWLKYFSETIDKYYSGEIAEKMKIRSHSIATVMQLKMDLYEN